MKAEALRIIDAFAIDTPLEVSEFAGRGNINLDTFLVTTASSRYLLQRINTDVFPQVDRVMSGMTASLEAQRSLLESGHTHGAAGWRAMQLVPTRDGRLYYDADSTWRLMSYIEGTVAYKSLSDVPASQRIGVAREVGRGLAMYSDLTAEIDPATVPVSLPGYRDTRTYFRQLHAALSGCRSEAEVETMLPEDEDAKSATRKHFLCTLDAQEWHSRRFRRDLQPFIELALDYEALALSLQEAREAGEIRTTVIHGDTKIENFLFDAVSGRVVSLVDLDTVMPLTWLADWGDMARSLCNPAGEKEPELSNVKISSEAYEAVLDGFLSTATSPMPKEIELMPRAVQAIALELGVRFLADYVRGDTYFALAPTDPPDLNLTRALVQLTLFQRLLEHESKAQRLIDSHSRRTMA